jgi:alpha-L-fucosidase
MARQHQPGLIVADRTVGGPYENILTPEQQVPDRPLPSTWESCLTMGNGWSYRPNDEYKPTRQLLHLLIDIVAKGGNLLLNIGPSPEGILDPEAVSRLDEIGQWMDINAEAIHGTRPIAPYAEGDVRYTSKGDTVYAHILSTDAGAAPPAEISLSIIPAAGSDVSLIGCPEPLQWRVDGSRAAISLPAALPCGHAWVLKYTR